MSRQERPNNLKVVVVTETLKSSGHYMYDTLTSTGAAFNTPLLSEISVGHQTRVPGGSGTRPEMQSQLGLTNPWGG